MSIPRFGGAPKRLARLPDTETEPTDVVVDDSYIYWLRWSPRPRPPGSRSWFGEIQRVPKSGGPPTTVVELAEQAVKLVKAGATIAFLTDRRAVKIARDNTEPLTLRAANLAYIEGQLAADDRAIYWAGSEPESPRSSATSKAAGVWSAAIPRPLR